MKSEATAAAARQECVGSVGHRVPVDFARPPPLVPASGSRVPVVFSVRSPVRVRCCTYNVRAGRTARVCSPRLLARDRDGSLVARAYFSLLRG